MRKVLVGAGVLALLGAALLGVALWNANRLVARYKPTIEATASDALHAPVTFGEMHAALFPTVRLEVADSQVGGPTGLTLASLTLHLRLLPLLAGRLDVTKLGLERPHVVILKDADGIGIVGLPRPKPGAATPAGGPAGGGSTGGGAGRPPVVGLTLRACELRHATIEYRDAVRKTTLTVTDLDADAGLEVNADAVRIPKFRADATAEGAVVHATGEDVRYDVASGKVTIPGVAVALNGQTLHVEGTVDTRAAAGELKVRSDTLDVAKLAAAAAPVAPAVHTLDPRGSATVDGAARFGPGNALDASGHLVLADVAARTGAGAVSGLAGTIDFGATATQRTVGSQQLQLRLADQPVTASFAAAATDDEATLQSLVAQAFGGTARATGTFGLASRKFAADLGAERLDLGKALAAADPSKRPQLSGTLARFQAHVGGTAGDTPESVQRSLAGSGSMALENGHYAGVNLLAEVLKALRSIPVVSTAVDDALPADVRKLGEGDGTTIGNLRTDFTLGGAAVHLANLALVNPALAFEGSGRVGFDRRLDIAGTVALSPEVSRSIAGRVKEIRFALDPLGRLAIPISISGTPPKVVVALNLSKLLSVGAAKNLIENQATKLLQGALGGKKKGKKDGGLPFKLRF